MVGRLDGWMERTGQDRAGQGLRERRRRKGERREEKCLSVCLEGVEKTRSQKHSPITIAIITKITIMGAVPGVLSIHTYIHLTQVTLPNLTYLTFLTLLDLTYLTY